MSETPNGSIVIAVRPGEIVSDDITESVKFAYDTVIQSLDWGSGFLDHEEQHLIHNLGKTLGFELPYMACNQKRVDYPAGKCTFQYPGEARIRCRATDAHWHTVDVGECQIRSDEDD